MIGRTAHGLLSATLSASIIILVLSFGQNAYMRLRYDDSAPITLRNFKLENAEAVVGGAIHYTADYDLREDCHPPLGSGTASYRFQSLETDAMLGSLIYDNVRNMRSTSWLPGKNVKGFGQIHIPPDLPAGTYNVIRTARYECANASHELVVTTANITIKVHPAQVASSTTKP